MSTQTPLTPSLATPQSASLTSKLGSTRPSSEAQKTLPASASTQLNRTEQLNAIGDVLNQARAAEAKAQGVDLQPPQDPIVPPKGGTPDHDLPADISDILEGDPAPQEGGEQEQEQAPVAEAPKTLNELSETTGFDAEALYDIEVTTGDGESISIGALKDAYQDRQTLTLETTKKEIALNERESAMIQEQAVWNEIGDAFQALTTPQQRNALAQQLESKVVRERAALGRAAPELNNAQAFQDFTQDMVKLGARYGIKPHEMVVNDHRQILLIRDALKNIKTLQKLKDYKPKKSAPRTTQTSGRKAPTNKRKQLIASAKNGSESDRINAVSALIKG